MDRPAPVGGVRVAAENVNQAHLGQGQHPGGEPLAQEEVRGRLNQRARGEQARDALVHIGGEVALGVGDQGAVAALGQVLDATGEAVGERTGGRLEQHPASSSQRHQRQLLLAQRLHRRLGDLPALQDDDRDPLFIQVAVQGRNPARDLLDANVVVVADVWSGADRLDAVPGRLARHAGAVAQVERPVVDTGEDVAVEVDHRQPSLAGVQTLVQDRAHPGTGLR